jgi:hypothetical protein
MVSFYSVDVEIGRGAGAFLYTLYLQSMDFSFGILIGVIRFALV